MKFTRKLTIAVVALIALATTATLAFPASSAENAREFSHASMVKTQNTVSALSSEVGMPTLNPIIFNTAVLYKWYAGENADQLSFGMPGYSHYFVNNTYFEELTFANEVDNICEPFNYIARSYNSETKQFSETYTISNDIGNRIIHGYPSNFIIKGKYNYAMAAQGNLPTSFDQTNYIWEHGAKNYRYVKATISYHGYVADIQVQVPPLGYKTESVILDGVTFSLRSGPWKCSIKVSQANQSNSTLRFAFGIT